ncbi:hypothetical protein [Sporosarcina ureae]|uniref:hypothetical protein n=1 Tax=Sporosarcina ureae TaxID=1571 RepID=UPI0026EB6952|nr:hypothetical protein [Sporosarcina ureae]
MGIFRRQPDRPVVEEKVTVQPTAVQSDNSRLKQVGTELTAAVAQHEKVNAQHNVLGEAVSDIESSFHIIQELSEKTTKSSAHELIVEHIHDAKEVDKRLESGIEQLLLK